MPELLSELDRRIIGALQFDGRASWRRIAEALDEPLRTVTRRGVELLDSGTVQVAGMPSQGPTCVIEIACEPARVDAIARELSEHPGVIFSYALANPTGVLVEVHEKTFDLETMTLEIIPSLAGVTGVSATPVLRYYASHDQWRPGLLSDAEAALLLAPTADTVPDDIVTELGSAEQTIVRMLTEDGRASVTQLAERAEVSVPTARRKLDSLQRSGAVTMRTLVEPALLGFGVEAGLWIDCAPQSVDAIGAALASLPEVRYAVRLLGGNALLVHASARSLGGLRAVIDAPVTELANSVHSSLIVRAYKRSGRPVLAAREHAAESR